MKPYEEWTQEESEGALETALASIDTRTPEEIASGLCPCCEEHKETVKCRRQNTAYVEEIKNFVVACDECFAAIEEYWGERWAELYNDVHAGIRAGNMVRR